MKPETRDNLTPRAEMLAKYLQEDAKWAILPGETPEDAAVRREADCLDLEERLVKDGVPYLAAKEIAEKETELFPPDADQIAAQEALDEADRQEAEEEAEQEPERFSLSRDDLAAVALAKRMARRLLIVKEITPSQIQAVARALHGLEQLPEVTPGCSVTVGICHRCDRAMNYVDVTISEHEFRMSQGGSVYDPAVGSDTISGPGWRVEVDGGRVESCDLDEQARLFDELIAMGGSVAVEDESDFEM